MSNSKSLVTSMLFVILLIACGLGGYVLLKDQQGPAISLAPADGRVNKNSVLEITLSDEKSGLKNLTVLIRKNTTTSTIYRQDWTDSPAQRVEQVDLSAAQLQEGAFEVIVRATDSSFAAFGKGNTSTREYAFRMDNTPPRVSVITMPPYVRRGGTGVVSYSVSEETSATGVMVGDVFFPGYRQANGNHLCFFAFPYYLTPKEYSPRLIARDLAGNEYDRPLSVYPLDRQFKTDIIRLTDSFFESKMPEFEQDVPGDMSHLERFLKVNRDIRVANRAALMSIGLQTAPEMVWKDQFMRLPNAANRASFAEKRTYIYNDAEVDEQYHLGHDLASTRHAPVPAGNHGKVVFADNLGIYGLLVVVDHGLGLQSLYSHLSEISVQPGQVVSKGDILGKTGVTGMAGGDHLHFEMVVSGFPVTPLEWFDPKWIRDNITGRLE